MHYHSNWENHICYKEEVLGMTPWSFTLPNILGLSYQFTGELLDLRVKVL